MSIQERDKKTVWHPFTQQINPSYAIPIVKAEGAYFYDENGKKYIDAISSWWVNLHGHCHPYLTQKITEQLNTNEHSLFSGFTHESGVRLAERLLGKLPSNQSKIFYSDDGSTSVEVAIKMTLQYWSNKNQNKTKIIAFENAYHGDTFGGMSVGARNAFNNAFSKLLFDVIHIPVPVKGKENDSLEAMKKALTDETVAAFIFEPLVQGAAGMIMYDESELDKLIELCKLKNVITIADEVMTGFGRTGKFFACDYLKNKPDIFCLSKGLTGGVMPLGVTSCAQFIHDAFVSEDKMKTFFHGHSYTGNPTACAASLASLDLFEIENTFDSIKRINECHQKFYEKIKNHSKIIEARIKGVILSIEIKTSEKTNYLNSLSEKITSFFIDKGIIVRPLGNVIYILPPYCITNKDAEFIHNAILEFLEQL